MPTVSQFYGIAIRMYFDDHPPPHFHAYYGSDAAKIEIDTLRVSEGKLRRRTLALVLEWRPNIARSFTRTGGLQTLTDR